jgi:hypothetical protein
MRHVLLLAGLYNLVWGTAVVLFPAFTFRIGGLFTPVHEGTDALLYRHLWQCIGMIVGVYGIGYAIAASDPVRHWPIVLVGLLGKLFGPVGSVLGIINGELPRSILWTNLTNDLIWLIPFTLILLHAYRASLYQASLPLAGGIESALEARSQHGTTLRELSMLAPTLVVFLRHFG